MTIQDFFNGLRPGRIEHETVMEMVLSGGDREAAALLEQVEQETGGNNPATSRKRPRLSRNKKKHMQDTVFLSYLEDGRMPPPWIGISDTTGISIIHVRGYPHRKTTRRLKKSLTPFTPNY